MTKTDIKRRKAFQRGLAAEQHVMDHLVAQGFEALSNRYKTKHGEIDLIVRREGLIVFVEVKARASLEEGLHSITPRAQRRIADSARLWIAENDGLITGGADFRFDVAVVTPDNKITILEAAFETSD